MNVKQFMAKTANDCRNMATRMAKLELQCWDEKHETELIKFFGFSKNTVKLRKIELEQKANQ